MLNRAHHPSTRSLILIAALGATSCSAFGGGKLDSVACPALGAAADPLSMRFSAQATLDAKVKTFVLAAKDMAAVSQQIEGEATMACQRMGADLGLSPAQMQPRQGAGGSASGACEAVGIAIDGILRQGVQVHATLQPPVCQANAQAQARCAGSCDVNTDAECRASCQAHADVNASCTPAVVTVQASQNAGLALRLLQTLQANLPTLIHAQVTLGQRLLGDAKIVAQVGAQLPKLVGNAGAEALACMAAAADVAASASIRIEVSVRASASVSGRVGT
jgi:hypothetical protein